MRGKLESGRELIPTPLFIGYKKGIYVWCSARLPTNRRGTDKNHPARNTVFGSKKKIEITVSLLWTFQVLGEDLVRR